MRAGFSRRHLLMTFMLAGSLLLGSCDDYPRDAQDTLESIRQAGILQVGVIENPPWVIRGASGPEGIEPEIVRDLASELGVEARWHWGSTAEVIHTLEQHQIQVVIGGLTAGPRLPTTVAATRSFHTTRYTVGFPPAMPMPDSLEGQTVAVPVISPLYKALRGKDAEPHPLYNREVSDFPLAGPLLRLEARGYLTGPWTLLTQKHVMVVPKGENAWMYMLQRHLNEVTSLDERIRRVETSQ